MGLNRNALKEAIKAASGADSIQEAQEAYANTLADGILAFVQSGVVNTNVSTTGSASAQTGTGVGSVS